ncbi:MAG: hypothetical protein Q4B54_07755, partial [Coriobacteriales bacterium]|nr:hypothetical protein [Coriobacteriales bacterium]
MAARYTQDQKTTLMLFGDLLDGSLTLAEKEILAAAVKAEKGDVQAALSSLTQRMNVKATELLTQGFRLSLELEKLGQRGVAIVFAEEMSASRVFELFAYAVPCLFVVGNGSLLEDPDVPTFFSLDAFKEADCKGMLVADSDLDALLCDGEVALALREMRAVLISNNVYARADVRSSRFEPSRSGQEKTGQERGVPSKYVFISGSRSQAEIPQVVQHSLDAIVEQSLGILIGDSDKGVDREIIDFLRVPLYQNVTIFTVRDQPRVKAEAAWRVRKIEADGSLRPQARQMEKDRAMANEADWGMVVFDPLRKNRYGSLQVSSGSLRNTVQMLLQGKAVKFFFLYEGELRVKHLKTLEDLESLIESYQNERLSLADRDSILTAKGVAGQDAAFVKSQKIMQKYRSLRRAEEKRLVAL